MIKMKRSMFKCCGIRKPDPLNPPHRGILKIKKEKLPKFLLIPFPHEEKDRVRSLIDKRNFPSRINNNQLFKNFIQIFLYSNVLIIFNNEVKLY